MFGIENDLKNLMTCLLPLLKYRKKFKTVSDAILTVIHIRFLLSTSILKSPNINLGIFGLFSFLKNSSRFSIKVILLYGGGLYKTMSLNLKFFVSVFKYDVSLKGLGISFTMCSVLFYKIITPSHREFLFLIAQLLKQGIT